MENFLEKVVNSVTSTNKNGELIPDNVKENLKKIGENGGQKYCDLVDKIVDTIFKK